jgi:hypothetical protein
MGKNEFMVAKILANYGNKIREKKEPSQEKLYAMLETIQK